MSQKAPFASELYVASVLGFPKVTAVPPEIVTVGAPVRGAAPATNPDPRIAGHTPASGLKEEADSTAVATDPDVPTLETMNGPPYPCAIGATIEVASELLYPGAFHVSGMPWPALSVAVPAVFVASMMLWLAKLNVYVFVPSTITTLARPWARPDEPETRRRCAPPPTPKLPVDPTVTALWLSATPPTVIEFAAIVPDASPTPSRKIA